MTERLATAITEAAVWLATAREPPRPVVPELKRRFNLTAAEACAAIKEAQLIRARSL